MMNKNLIIIGVMAVLLAGAVAYIGLNEWEQATAELNQTAYLKGWQDGLTFGQASVFDGAYSGGAVTLSNFTVLSPQGCINYCNNLIQNNRVAE